MARRAVGQWDQGLFERYRALDPAAKEARALLGEILRVNEPLVEDLVLQRAGRKRARGKGAGQLVVHGSEHLSASEVLDAGRIAMVVAMRTFDPSLGKLAGFLNWKVVDELERAVQELGIVRRGRHRPLARMEYFEDSAELAQAFEESTAVTIDGAEEAPPKRRRAKKPKRPRPRPAMDEKRSPPGLSAGGQLSEPAASKTTSPTGMRRASTLRPRKAA